jgi:hypothetical protein
LLTAIRNCTFDAEKTVGIKSWLSGQKGQLSHFTLVGTPVSVLLSTLKGTQDSSLLNYLIVNLE